MAFKPLTPHLTSKYSFFQDTVQEYFYSRTFSNTLQIKPTILYCFLIVSYKESYQRIISFTELLDYKLLESLYH